MAEPYGPAAETDVHGKKMDGNQVEGFTPRAHMPGVFEKSFNIDAPLNDVLKEVEYGLVANNWIDENTQALYVEEALLCLLQVKFVRVPASGVIGTIDVQSITAN